jgi:cell division protein FtsZ
VLGPTTQKQADKSRQALDDVDVDDSTFDASQNVDTLDSGAGSQGSNDRGYGHTDGGRSNVEKNNGVDVIRPD